MSTKTKNFGVTRSKVLDFDDENDKNQINLKTQKTLSQNNLPDTLKKRKSKSKIVVSDKKLFEE